MTKKRNAENPVTTATNRQDRLDAMGAVLPIPPAGVAGTAMEAFVSSRDADLGGNVPPSALPATDEEFRDRDPFSADYADFWEDQRAAKIKKEGQVDQEMRADLLAQPHLMENPEESAMRGSAAVWRSLRGILGRDVEAILDSSNLSELDAFRRELESRQILVDAVSDTMGAQVKRLKSLIAEFTAEERAKFDRDKG